MRIHIQKHVNMHMHIHIHIHLHIHIYIYIYIYIWIYIYTHRPNVYNEGPQEEGPSIWVAPGLRCRSPRRPASPRASPRRRPYRTGGGALRAQDKDSEVFHVGFIWALSVFVGLIISLF